MHQPIYTLSFIITDVPVGRADEGALQLVPRQGAPQPAHRLLPAHPAQQPLPRPQLLSQLHHLLRGQEELQAQHHPHTQVIS